jgi:hypothetical protein
MHAAAPQVLAGIQRENNSKEQQPHQKIQWVFLLQVYLWHQQIGI